MSDNTLTFEDLKEAIKKLDEMYPKIPDSILKLLNGRNPSEFILLINGEYEGRTLGIPFLVSDGEHLEVKFSPHIPKFDKDGNPCFFLMDKHKLQINIDQTKEDLKKEFKKHAYGRYFVSSPSGF